MFRHKNAGLALLLSASMVAASCGGSSNGDSAQPAENDVARNVGQGDGDTAVGDEPIDSAATAADSAAVVAAGTFDGAFDLDTLGANPAGLPDGFFDPVDEDPDADPEEPDPDPEDDDVDDPPEDNTAPTTAPEADPGSGVPSLQAVLEANSFDGPCDLFEEDELGTLISDWANSSGVLDEVNTRVGASGSVVFDESPGDEVGCDWFSADHFWLVNITWQPADPIYLATVYDSLLQTGGVVPIGDGSGFVSSPSTALLSVNGLFITVTNVIPSAASIEGDGDVTLALAQAVADRVRA